jgi:hypothetical protein
MKYPIKVTNLTPALEYYAELAVLVQESKDYLNSHSWCTKINDGWVFINLGRVLCIFLYAIENNQSPDDNLLWVVVGDLPAAYLDTFTVSDTKDVLKVYTELVNDWIVHVESNQSLDDCFPLKSDRSLESTEMVKRRIVLLQNNIMPEIGEMRFDLIYI